MIDWSWKEVDQLEEEEKWFEAYHYMKEEWNHNPTFKTTARLSFFCWQMIEEWGFYPDTGLDYDELQNTLRELTEYGLRNYKDEPEYLWILGYMSSIIPYPFGDYEEWEEKGVFFLKRAHELKPDDPIFSFFYKGDRLSKREYQKEKLALVPIIRQRFQGNGVLQSYFREIYGREENTKIKRK